jgi:actin-related protein 6
MGTAKGSSTSKSARPQSLPSKTFIVDNGAYTIKAGFANPISEDETADSLSGCVQIPNALTRTRDKRIYTGAELSTQVADWNEAVFRRPVEKGFIVNWEAQREIWEHTFFDEKTARDPAVRCADPKDTTLILTEAPNAMAALQKNADEMIMEEWSFGGYARCLGV